VEKALKGLLEPEMVEKVIGKAEVLATFKISKSNVWLDAAYLKAKFDGTPLCASSEMIRLFITGEMLP
jgi:hypothetical protein